MSEPTYDELINILSCIVGSYQLEHIINWYRFASSVGKVKLDFVSNIDYIYSYYADKEIELRIIPNQSRHLHIWKKHEFEFRFRFESDDEHAPTIEDYHIMVKYFEKKYDENKDYITDPLLDGLSVDVKPTMQL